MVKKGCIIGQIDPYTTWLKISADSWLQSGQLDMFSRNKHLVLFASSAWEGLYIKSGIPRGMEVKLQDSFYRHFLPLPWKV
mmetsp:Transcript_12418/g.12191  ORF Transcript_12418/g.12191 Transcript_12418/m.12191 type:complete len:81 (-) Transcript_12418:206-448(-)